MSPINQGLITLSEIRDCNGGAGSPIEASCVQGDSGLDFGTYRLSDFQRQFSSTDTELSIHDSENNGVVVKES